MRTNRVIVELLTTITVIILINSCVSDESVDLEIGKKTHPRHVWIHGVGGSPFHYLPFALRTPEVYSQIYDRYDSLGLNWQEQMHALHKVVTQQPNPVTLLGHSYGGSLALAYALTFPENVDHLVLIAAPLRELSRWEKWGAKFLQWIPISVVQTTVTEANEIGKIIKYIKGIKRPLPMRVSLLYGAKDYKVRFRKEDMRGFVGRETMYWVLKEKGHGFHFQDPDLVLNLIGLKTL